MLSDSASLLIFSLVIVAVNIVILILLQETGRPIASMVSAAACIFCIQQAFSAYQIRHISTLVQALGASAFFCCLLFSLLLQMQLGLKEPAKTQR